MSFDDFKALAGLTFRDPQAAARWLMGQGWPTSARWMALVLTVVIAALLAFVASALAPAPVEGDPRVVNLTQFPMIIAAIQLVAMVVAAGLMASVGRMFGGQGRFDDALVLVIWIEVLLLMVQAIQIVLALLVPAVAGILGLAAIVLFLWLTVQFVKALHGFTNSFKVVLVMVATMITVGFVLSFILAGFGLIPQVVQP